PGPRPAGGRGLGPFPATLGREVRLRLLPSQPGRLPRLDPCAARRRPGDGRPPEPATGPGRLTERPPSLLPRLRLVPGPDAPGRLHLAPLVQDVPELAERLVLVGSKVVGHHHVRAGPVRPGVLAAGRRADQERAVGDLDVIPHLVPGNA